VRVRESAAWKGGAARFVRVSWAVKGQDSDFRVSVEQDWGRVIDVGLEKVIIRVWGWV
jgi:hypothetical protein